MKNGALFQTPLRTGNRILSMYTSTNTNTNIIPSLYALPSDELLDREGALQKGAGIIQKLYWAQFADDTYSGSLRLLTPESSSKAMKLSNTNANTNTITNSNTNSNTNTKPRAPTAALLPATAVRYTMDSMSHLLSSTDNPPPHPKDILLQFQNLFTLSELSSTTQLRKAFNTFTASLQFSDTFSVNLPEKSQERKQYIQQNTNLLNSRTAIVSDLDLRDLHRNQILTLVEDLRAEIQYQQGAKEEELMELGEIRDILNKVQLELDIWFGFIDENDVKEAFEVYIAQPRQS